MFEDNHVIELSDKPGWVQFKAHPDVVVELSTYQERLLRESQQSEQRVSNLRRQVIRRMKHICRVKGYPHPDQSGIRVLSWNLIRLGQTTRAKALPKAITNFTTDVYHWQHLIYAVAFLTLKETTIKCDKFDVILSASEYVTDDRALMLETREQLLNSLDAQLDQVELDVPLNKTDNINERVTNLEKAINEIRDLLRVQDRGTEEGSLRPGKKRSKQRS